MMYSVPDKSGLQDYPHGGSSPRPAMTSCRGALIGRALQPQGRRALCLSPDHLRQNPAVGTGGSPSVRSPMARTASLAPLRSPIVREFVAWADSDGPFEAVERLQRVIDSRLRARCRRWRGVSRERPPDRLPAGTAGATMGRGRHPRYGPLAVENFFASAPKRHPAEATTLRSHC